MKKDRKEKERRKEGKEEGGEGGGVGRSNHFQIALAPMNTDLPTYLQIHTHTHIYTSTLRHMLAVHMYILKYTCGLLL